MRQANHSPTKRKRAGYRSPRRERHRRGVSAIEYVLLISFISIGLVAAVEHLGGSVSGAVGVVSSTLSGEGGDGGSQASDRSPGNGPGRARTSPSSDGSGKLKGSGGNKWKNGR